MTNDTLFIVGLTGNIATGKSTVAGMLSALGACVIDADDLAHQAMQEGTPVWQQVVREFGTDILQSKGEIDRGELGRRVFADPEALHQLEEIVHPAVIGESERLLQELCAQAAHSSDGYRTIVVLEAVKLIESGMHQRCDEIWVVSCQREQQMQRLMQARGLSAADAGLRIDAQPPLREKLLHADVVIDNSGSLKQTRAQVLQHWERIKSEQAVPQTTLSGLLSGGEMSSWRRFVDEHPFLTMWAVLAVGMVAIFLVTSKDVDLLPSQRLFMALACVGVAGLCTWIISWE